MLSALATPFSAMVFFFEVNSPRNISFYQILKAFLIGGLLSLVITLMVGAFIHQDFSLIGSIGIGLAEEIRKAAAVMIFVNRLTSSGRHYILNGLLVGAAVGAGFAVFETAGYIYRVSASAGLAAGLNTAFMRGILAIGGHVIWAAMEGAAMCAVSKGKRVEISHLLSPQYLSTFCVPVLLHAAWDWNFMNGSAKYLAIVAAGWVVILAYINRGIKEVNRIMEEGVMLDNGAIVLLPENTAEEETAGEADLASA